MTAAAGFLIGYLIGSIPTADLIARRARIDLRAAGSGNPGANNALRLGGRRLAAAVLVAELVKGAAIVTIAGTVAPVAVAGAAVGAVAGNVFNPWYRFRGGQGLGIAGGVLAAAWPPGLVVALLTVAVVSAATRSSRLGAVAAVASLALAAAVSHPLTRWGWGVEGHHLAIATGVGLVIVAKQSVLVARDRRP